MISDLSVCKATFAKKMEDSAILVSASISSIAVGAFNFLWYATAWKNSKSKMLKLSAWYC